MPVSAETDSGIDPGLGCVIELNTTPGTSLRRPLIGLEAAAPSCAYVKRNLKCQARIEHIMKRDSHLTAASLLSRCISG